MIEKIYIDKEVKSWARTKEILDKYDGIEKQVIDLDQNSLQIENQISLVDKSKKNILLTLNKGKFVKKCPGTKSHLCCNYYVITPIYNCPLDCSYCFLQGHINSPFIKIFVNDEKIFSEIDEITNKNPCNEYRFGTGEFSDSLAFEDINDFAKKIFPYIENKSNIVLELKTKTNNIKSLLSIKPLDNVVIAWSVNPQKIIDKEEIETASLDERLEAAYKCQEYGYKIAFHFDPIIYSLSWENDYKLLINQIFEKIKPNKIAWISLGMLRYTPETKEVIQKRFPNSKIIYGEMMQGLDGKYRYFKKIREKVFSKILGYLKEVDQDLLIYMCMEGDFMWKKVYGNIPNCTDVKSLFDNKVI